MRMSSSAARFRDGTSIVGGRCKPKVWSALIASERSGGRLRRCTATIRRTQRMLQEEGRSRGRELLADALLWLSDETSWGL